MKKHFFRTKALVTIALLIALTIVIARFLSIQTPIMRISLSFIPTALCSMLFGPFAGALSAFLSDFLGMLINSKGMAYFIGFGISEALYGFTYGLFLYKRPKTFLHIIICVLLQMIFIDIGLGSLWASITAGTPFFAVLSTRIVRALLMVPIKVFGIKYIWESVGKRLNTSL